MSSFIYTSYAGADPNRGWTMSDPILSDVPTLGACVPNLRRAVKLGDWVFTISGRVAGAAQYVVGGFQVAEKIDQLAAFKRFPENRVQRAENGQMIGNVIVTADGKQHPDDRHKNFENRIENYLVGRNPIFLSEPEQVARGRAETLQFLSALFNRQGNRVFDVIGRGRKMDDEQVAALRRWLEEIQR